MASSTADQKLQTAIAESDAELAKQQQGSVDTDRQLSVGEVKTLAECETIVERGCKAFIEVGRALTTIRDQRLYRQTHTTFEQYVKDRWSFGRAHAYRLIGSAETADVLSPIGVHPTSAYLAW